MKNCDFYQKYLCEKVIISVTSMETNPHLVIRVLVEFWTTFPQIMVFSNSQKTVIFQIFLVFCKFIIFWNFRKIVILHLKTPIVDFVFIKNHNFLKSVKTMKFYEKVMKGYHFFRGFQNPVEFRDF